MKESATAEVRKKIRLLNLLVSFVTVTLLFVILRYLYGPLRQLLSFLPDTSMVVIVLFAMVVATAGLYVSKVLSGQVISKIEDYGKRLDSILTITRDIREEIYGDILLDKIMGCSLAITGSDAGSILLREDDTLVFEIVKGIKAGELPGKSIPKDTGVAGWVLLHGEPLMVEDVAKDDRYNPTIDAFTGYQTKSMLCVPLKTKAATIGVIELVNKKQGLYDDRDLEMLTYLADHAAISIERARFYDDQRNYEIHLTDILLDTIDRFLPEKRGHSRRVATYANTIAKALGMQEEKKRRLYFASLLHDIGFIRIPPEKAFEKEAFVLHPVIGYEMLHPITFYKDVAPYILYHHERFNGGGYPKDLRGDAIPLEARIIAIAEAFDSMVSKLSYRVPIDFDIALGELMKNKGGQFDPDLVDLFVRDIKEPLD